MKSTGIVRNVDDLGRVVIPKELRKILMIEKKDPLEIFTEGNLIILRSYNPLCLFCRDGKNLKEFKGKKICADCCSAISGKKE